MIKLINVILSAQFLLDKKRHGIKTLITVLRVRVSHLFILIAPFLIFCPFPQTAGAASQAQIRQAQALAMPVLRNGTSDAQFLHHIRTLSGSGSSETNILSMLYLVFKESIKEQSEDKKYYLLKLKQFNTMAEALSDYLKELNKSAEELGNGVATAAGPLAKAEAALQKFEVKLSMADLPVAEKKALQDMISQDRRFYRNAHQLEQRVRSIAQTTPRPPDRDTAPQRSTNPIPPQRLRR